MPRKAAIEMSLGLIVAVVFAVVLLSLAIVWIQGLIGDITGLTKDLTNQAQIKLRDTFATTTTNFAIWPTEAELKPREGIKLLAGIKNNAPDSRRHDFVINVVAAGASSSICPGGNVEDCDSPLDGVTLKEYMERWVTVDRTVASIVVQTPAYKSITIQIPESGAPAGYYMFNVVTCYDRNADGSIVTPVSSECVGNSPNIWSNAASLTIQVAQ
jgi:hypothetical protein